MLDELVGVIETLQSRIRDHGDALRQNEIRTRTSLIDPLLSALGWDTADPGLVTPEYDVGGGRADYALWGQDRSPIAFLEAKRLDEPLESPRNQEQVFLYALKRQVKYAGLTNGNEWILDNLAVFDGERRILQVSIADTPAQQCALKLLLLWRPNLASGQPVKANEPVLVAEPQPDPTLDLGDGWKSLADMQGVSGQQVPSAISLPDGKVMDLKIWKDILLGVAEYLVRTGKLTERNCPVSAPKGSKRYIVHREAIHSDGKRFTSKRDLSNGLFCETNDSSDRLISHAKSLLEHFGEDPASVWLKVG